MHVLIFAPSSVYQWCLIQWEGFCHTLIRIAVLIVISVYGHVLLTHLRLGIILSIAL